MTRPHGEHIGPPRPLPICDALHGCITCSDEGVPMHVVEVLEGGELVACDDGRGNRSEVMTGIVGDVAVGDTLLVHAGTAILLLNNADGAGE